MKADIHYLNADFDLGLRPRARQTLEGRLDRQVRELSTQAILGARPGDAALVRADVPDELLDYLDAAGVTSPRILTHPRIESGGQLRPFGWSSEAIELNRQCDQPVAHPPLSIIERVNSRRFSANLEVDLDREAPFGAVIDDLSELERFLSRADVGSEWVIKADHGNAGLANRRVVAPKLSGADRRFVEGLFAEDDQLVIERWLERVRDWSVVFEVPFDPSRVRVHETAGTRDGALLGALFAPDSPETMPWFESLREMAQQVASRLGAAGYFGPVCVDAFEWRDADSIKFRPLVDLNCRRSMSDGAYRLWRQLAPDRAFYYRLFNRRKLRLPATLPQALAALGDQRYDRSRRQGTLLASPVGFSRLAVIFVAEDRRSVFALQDKFRERFEA